MPSLYEHDIINILMYSEYILNKSSNQLLSLPVSTDHIQRELKRRNYLIMEWTTEEEQELLCQASKKQP